MPKQLKERGFGNYMHNLPYIGSAFIGIAVILLCTRLWSRFYAEKEPK
jgi:hypothetical protein